MPNHAYRRICIAKNGYAVVPGASDQEAIENAAALANSDFDWEPVTGELIRDEAQVIDVLDEDRNPLPMQAPDVISLTGQALSGATVRIAMIRHNRRDPAEQALIDMIEMPAEYAAGPRGKARSRIDMALRKILDAWLQTLPERPEGRPEPVDLTRIPEDFLRRYGMRIEPVDTALDIEYAMDQDFSVREE